jgi:hypothetical protein
MFKNMKVDKLETGFYRFNCNEFTGIFDRLITSNYLPYSRYLEWLRGDIDLLQFTGADTLFLMFHGNKAGYIPAPLYLRILNILSNPNVECKIRIITCYPYYMKKYNPDLADYILTDSMDILLTGYIEYQSKLVIYNPISNLEWR